MKQIPNAKQHRKKLRSKKLFEQALQERDEYRRKMMIRRARLKSMIGKR